jgi:alpha-L-fucosidase
LSIVNLISLSREQITTFYEESKVILKDYKVKANTRVSVLGSSKVLKATNVGNNCEVDLSGFKPGEIPGELLVLKFQNML